MKVLKLFELLEKCQDLLAKNKRALTGLVPIGHVSAPDVKAEYLCVSRRRVEVQAPPGSASRVGSEICIRLHQSARICAVLHARRYFDGGR